mgnify:CR=1 FL=1
MRLAQFESWSIRAPKFLKEKHNISQYVKKSSNIIRRKQRKHQKVSEIQLEDFPDILIEVFKHLELKDLLICAQVSPEFKVICKDQDVCEKINQNQQQSIESNYKIFITKDCFCFKVTLSIK